MTNLQSSDALLQRLREVAKLKPTSEQVHRQRVSFILSSMKEKSGVTRERVEKVLREQEGK